MRKYVLRCVSGLMAVAMALSLLSPASTGNVANAADDEILLENENLSFEESEEDLFVEDILSDDDLEEENRSENQDEISDVWDEQLNETDEAASSIISVDEYTEECEENLFEDDILQNQEPANAINDISSNDKAVTDVNKGSDSNNAKIAELRIISAGKNPKLYASSALTPTLTRFGEVAGDDIANIDISQSGQTYDLELSIGKSISLKGDVLPKKQRKSIKKLHMKTLLRTYITIGMYQTKE